LDGAAQPGFGLFIEGRHAHIAKIAAFQPEADDLRADDIARQRQFNGAISPWAANGDADLRAALPAHLFHRFLEREPLDRGAVQMRDEIPRLHARAGGRGFINGADDFDVAAFLRHLDPEAAKLAPGLGLHIPEAALIEVGGMRIQAGKHALDGIFNGVPVIDRFHIFGADPLKHIAKQVEQAIGLGPSPLLRPSCHQRADHNPGGKGGANARYCSKTALHALTPFPSTGTAGPLVGCKIDIDWPSRDPEPPHFD